ncbi:MAG: hypothetical protein JO258_06760 [Alphaproteobacteria bacterium]|nr:hypothetical protein [Alphaproteobacteria bacterium]
MKAFAIPAILAAAFGVAVAPVAVAIYRDAFPADPARRAALAACAQDAGFNRLIAADRARCYAQALSPAAPPPPVPRRLQIV